MSEIFDLHVPLAALDHPLPTLAARALGWPLDRVGEIRVLRRSLDARRSRGGRGSGGDLGYVLRVEVGRAGETLAPRSTPAPGAALRWPAGRPAPRVVVVGTGPAGTWAALRLAEAGIAATVLERGKPVQPRRRDLAQLQRGQLDPESNYCFGEGGAGTYSDGKLYTRSKDREGVAAVLADLVRFGAPADIEVESRPHVGSNRLPKVLTALRLHLESLGVSYLFGAEVSGLVIDRGRVRAVKLAGGGELPADAVVLAVGHSARSVYGWLGRAGVPIERKAIAVGVRIEHPQPVIDRMQYGMEARDPRLPPAFYELKAPARGRTIYSFCMCPGGWIVPAATEEGGVVVNGMSLSKRDSPYANAGMVVPVEVGDFGPAADGILAGVDFQRRIEQAAFTAGGGRFRAPAQGLLDFLAGRDSAALPSTSYHPGVAPAPLECVFPSFVVEALRDGLAALGRRYPILLTREAMLIAAETRTSAPVRIPRDVRSLESPGVAGLYPAGEGAGYAGGIVSAALDGVRVADAILATGGLSS